MASLSLLPKAAWDLNKQLRRDVTPVVTLRVNPATAAAVLQGVMASKSVKRLLGRTGLPPRLRDLPDSIRSMTLLGVQGQLELGVLPQHLDSFSLMAAANIGSSSLAACLNALPQSVRRLSFSCTTLRHLLSMADVKLPARLEELELRNIRALTALPASLTSIKLAQCRLPLALQLPASLTSVRFDDVFCTRDAFDMKCLPSLPQQLRKLDLLSLDPSLPVAPLPPALLDLYISYDGSHTMAVGSAAQPLAPLPETLKTIQVTDYSDSLRPILGPLPQSLEVLDVQHCREINSPLGQLPPALTALRLGQHFTQALGPRPAQLRVLDLGTCRHFNVALGALPPALRELRVGDAFDQPLPPLPSTLEVLALGNAFSQPLQRALPSALRTFEMGDLFNAPVALPGTLQSLSIGDSYTHLLELPPGLKELRIGQSYTHAVPSLRLAHVRCSQAYPHAVVSDFVVVWDADSDSDDSDAE
ncbi:hypothetical protein JKP88DRAFT_325866 [Tribonema minus]|uniref:Uncharacterized protein n=1 Tax=Tribonema minus TaxID=303371 RepID=A0A835Z074_9STRA|nr:hypothetical protein JKP88DRAFT_325866 [Tribonema minus]